MKNALFFMVFLSCSLFVCNHGCPRQTVRRRSRRNSVSLRRVFRIRSDPEKDLQREDFSGRGAADVKSAAFRKAKRPQNAPCRATSVTVDAHSARRFRALRGARKKRSALLGYFSFLAAPGRLELSTLRLTAACSTD